jgi:hypothetical protein
MKLTRAAFLAGLGVLIVTAGVSMATPGNGHGHGGGRGHAKKKVVNGVVTTVNSEGGTFVLHRNGGRGHGGAGSDVTVVTGENTVFLRSDETDGSFADLAEGVKAQAKGTYNEDGSLQAVRVLIKVEEETEE